jgi:hypothetical protein
MKLARLYIVGVFCIAALTNRMLMLHMIYQSIQLAPIGCGKEDKALICTPLYKHM